MESLRILSTLAVKGAFAELAQRFGAKSGVKVEADFAPTVALLHRIRMGEAADVLILTREGLGEMLSEHRLAAASYADIAKSWVGIAVKAGRPHPDISSEAALRTALVQARAVAYSRIGASGIMFADLIARLGIAHIVNEHAVVIPSGLTAERLLTDEADLAVQQISELKQVAGVEIVGPIPHHLQAPAIFSAGCMLATEKVVPAEQFLAFLRSPEAAAVLREAGLEP
jgi:molybdate transport system substrate-binding protein